MKLQKYFAEMLGAFMLTFTVSLSLVSDLPLATPLIAGLTLGLFVYTVGGISGAHLNPAVTIGLASIKKIDIKEAAIYILSQIIGALLAMYLLQSLYGQSVEPIVDNKIFTGIAEALGAFILTFGVCSVVYEKAPKCASGLVIGSSLFLGIAATSTLSNGVLNPAVAIGISSISLMYIIGPLVGGILGAWTYKFLASK